MLFKLVSPLISIATLSTVTGWYSELDQFEIFIQTQLEHGLHHIHKNNPALMPSLVELCFSIYWNMMEVMSSS